LEKRGPSFAKPRGPNGKLKVHYNNQNISSDVVPLKLCAKAEKQSFKFYLSRTGAKICFIELKQELVSLFLQN
jgi:hypothetical protein